MPLKNPISEILTLDLLIPGGKEYHRWDPEKLKGFCWAKDACVYVRENKLYKVYCASGNHPAHTLLLTLEKLNGQLNAYGLKAVPKMPLPIVPSLADPVVVLEPAGAIVWVNAGTGSIEQVILAEKEWKNRVYLPSAHAFLCTFQNNLWRIGVEEKRQLTFETDPAVVAGEPAHRNEWGITQGIFLSPSGEKAAFYRTDTSKESRYFFADSGLPGEEQESCRYPFAGQPNPAVTIGIVELENFKIHYLKTPDPEAYFYAGITWGKDEASLYITEIERSQQHYRLCRYDAATGKLQKVLLEESSPRYVEPLFPPFPVPAGGGKEGFVWASRKDGWQHLYLYDDEGRPIRRLTEGSWEVTRLVGSDANGNILYLSTELSPLDQTLYSVSLKGEKRRLSEEEGISDPRISACGKYILNAFTAPNVPRRVDLISLPSPDAEIVHKTDLASFDAENALRVHTGVIPAANGKTLLHYRICLPPEFDPEQKYPAVQYVYGGPHVQLVNHAWLYNAQGWELYLASRGYVVFVLDPRGSKNRGREFEQSIFRHLGVLSEADLIKGAEWLKSQPWIDPSRIGVYGWSFGGYMALNLLLRHPGYFKAGVAGGAVINWRWYEIMYTERYMQTPQKNPEGYDSTDLTGLAHHLSDPLLLIHGGRDPVVLPLHFHRFLEACVAAGKRPSVFLYPGQGHNMEGEEKVHLYRLISQFFEREL